MTHLTSTLPTRGAIRSTRPSLPTAAGLILTFLGLGAVPAEAVPAPAGTEWHVDAAAAPGGDGLSWATAFDSIDLAIAWAIEEDRIWVKEGSYTVARPTDAADPRTATFSIAMGVELLGGFDGTETSFSERAGLFDTTILSGDLGVLGDWTDNAYHVVTAVNPPGVPTGATTVDGFTIQGGNADGVGHGRGGGVLMFNAALRLRNCTLRDNRAVDGAGLHAQPGIAHLGWCNFIDNHARNNGGGSWGQALNYKASHCRFQGNTAMKGGAIYLNGVASGGPTSFETPIMIGNSLFHDNVAQRGGAVFLGGGHYASGAAVFRGCTFAFNRATESGGAIFARTESLVPAKSKLLNSVVWFNTAPVDPNLRGRHRVAFSNIEDPGYPGAGTLSVDPLFVDGPGRDLRLVSGSPSNDAGSNALIPMDLLDADGDGDYLEQVPIDLLGGRRVADDPGAPNDGGWMNPIVDMGAYEL